MDENGFEGMWMVGGASHLERRVVLLSGHCEIRRRAAIYCGWLRRVA